MAPSNTNDVVPMKAAVFGALGMAWGMGIAAGGVGLNALIKGNQEQTRLKRHVPPPTILTIDIHDVFNTGVVVTTVSALVGVICSTAILLLFTPFLRVPSYSGTIRTVAYTLTFCAAWLLAALIPYTFYFATRSAVVTATVNGIKLPDGLVEKAQASLGATSIYHKMYFLRLVATVPWATFLFTVIASIVLFTAASRATSHAMTHASHATDDRASDDMMEKAKSAERL
jgi:hypothetical protein